jgi:hypothetical protein
VVRGDVLYGVDLKAEDTGFCSFILGGIEMIFLLSLLVFIKYSGAWIKRSLSLYPFQRPHFSPSYPLVKAKKRRMQGQFGTQSSR